MKNSRIALSLVAVLALAGCGAGSSAADKEPVKNGDDKSPLAEYMGDGFINNSGGGMVTTRAIGGPNESSEEQLAKQRKIEESTAACMKSAGFDYVVVPPEQKGKGKFDEAFSLPPDKFAEQYGYGVSTIDWGKPDDAEKDDPNAKIRKALSPNAQKAYDNALNGQLATSGNGSGGVISMQPADGKGKPMDTGCRGKAAEEVYGKAEDHQADFAKFDSLFKDLEALRKRFEADQRVIDATSAWADCLADAGHSGFKKLDDPRSSISDKLDKLTGAKKNGGPTSAGGDGKGNVTVFQAPSLDKVPAAQLADLRKEEIDLAKADVGCKKKVYDEPAKKAQYELEKEFVAANKTQLEAYRDSVSER
ncbi:hypothetical protein [Kribbella sp. NPDC051718]|uniref:hypothetical protein n=1 Tax=Kribbella sp. NPDC051718 TaxID=3155168 RepID=UPI0034433584